MSDRPNVRLFASSDPEAHPEATLGMFRCRARGAVSVPFGRSAARFGVGRDAVSSLRARRRSRRKESDDLGAVTRAAPGGIGRRRFGVGVSVAVSFRWTI